MCEVYRIFSHDWDRICDYSDEMMMQLYLAESYGGQVSNNNGYALGKKWLSVNVAMWKQDIEQGFLRKQELYDDGKFPHWWLDNIFKTNSKAN